LEAAPTDRTDSPPILPPGTYTVVVELQGFNTIKREGVIVRVGMTVELNFEMAQAAINQEVTVTAASPVVDVVSPKVAQNATTEVIESLPFSDRDVWTFAVTTAAGSRGKSIHDGSGSRAPKGISVKVLMLMN
jgi:hypothetical protein